jgi:putative transferase (TIGR04331 family)
MESNEFWGIYSKDRVVMTNNLSVILSKILNIIHGTHFSERFWKIILRPYISAIISDRQLLSSKIFYRSVPLDNYSNTVFPKTYDILYGKGRYFIKYLKCLSSQVKDESLANFNNIGLGFHDKTSFEKNIDFFIESKYPIFLEKRLLNNLRNLDIKFFVDQTFSEIFIRNIISHLPKVYVENFWGLFNSIQIYDPKDKIFHVSYFENFFMSCLVAKYVENGAKLYYYQHGAFYGEYPYHSAHHFESSISDKFFTWGWKILENDYPSHAYRLKRMKKYCAHSSINRAVDMLLVFPDLTARNRTTIIERTSTLLRGVNRDIMQIIVARPRPSAKLNRRASLSFLPDSVVVDSGFSSMIDLIATSNLVIQISLPSTNFLECLSIDQPVIGLLDNDDPSDAVKSHYEFLISVGIIHKDIHTLIDHVNNIDLNEWWKGILLMKGYKKFKTEFLNLDN